METPILKQGNILIATLQSSLSDDDLLLLRNNLVEKVKKFRSTGVVIDVTILDVIDSFAARTLSNLADMIKLCGAETVIVGIQPSVAFAMVQLGLLLKDVKTALDLDDGLVLLKNMAEEDKDNGKRNKYYN